MQLFYYENLIFSFISSYNGTEIAADFKMGSIKSDDNKNIANTNDTSNNANNTKILNYENDINEDGYLFS